MARHLDQRQSRLVVAPEMVDDLVPAHPGKRPALHGDVIEVQNQAPSSTQVAS